MIDASIPLNQLVFAKTTLGQEEIQSKSLGLPPMLRRLLILIDGKRNAAELSTMLTGQDLLTMMSELLAKACIVLCPKNVAAIPIAKAAAPVSPAQPALTGLPDAQTRSAKEVDMARNFMINTLNMAFGQHHCLGLIDAISQCTDANALRLHYPEWFKTMNSSRSSAKELPELCKRLSSVL